MSLSQRFPPPPQAPEPTPAAAASAKGCGCLVTLFTVFAALLVLAAFVVANNLPSAISGGSNQMSAREAIFSWTVFSGLAGFVFLLALALATFADWFFTWFRLAVAAPATLRELLAAQQETNRLLGELLTTVKAGEPSPAASEKKTGPNH